MLLLDGIDLKFLLHLNLFLLCSSSDNDPGVSLIDKFLKKKTPGGGKDDEVSNLIYHSYDVKDVDVNVG